MENLYFRVARNTAEHVLSAEKHCGARFHQKWIIDTDDNHETDCKIDVLLKESYTDCTRS